MMKMRRWNKMIIPMRKVWTKVSKRIGLRKTGIGKLRQDVKTSEYKDVHILWEKLKRNDSDITKSKKKRWLNLGRLAKRLAKHVPLLRR